MKPLAEVRKRQEKVKMYLLRGLTNAEIAKLTGVTERTIERDRAKIGDIQLKSLEELTPQKLIAESKERREAINRELWILFHNAEGKNAAHIKMLAMRLLMQADKQFIDICQSVGIIPSQSDTHLNVGVQNIIELKTELLDKLVGATIEFVPEASLGPWNVK